MKYMWAFGSARRAAARVTAVCQERGAGELAEDRLVLERGRHGVGFRDVEGRPPQIASLLAEGSASAPRGGQAPTEGAVHDF